VDLTSHEVYEIKIIDQESLGYAQLGGYLIILNLDDKQHRAWIAGESYEPPRLIPLGDGLHEALVDPPLEGVITYQIVGFEHVLSLAAIAVKAAQSAVAELGLDFGVGSIEAAAGIP
jgi:hypothetical protein